MGHIIDKDVEQPYMCEDCKHYLYGLTCAAYDFIPAKIIEAGAESHDHVMPGQKGDYVFATDKPRNTMRVYVDGDEAPDA